MDRLTTREVGATFAELIRADLQWLDEEFSALMAATFTAPPEWPRPPAPPHRASPHAPAVRGWRRWGWLPRAQAPVTRVHLRDDAHGASQPGRQRAGLGKHQRACSAGKRTPSRAKRRMTS